MEGVDGMKDILEFYRGRRVLLTGHTGFKGAWLAFLLSRAGAEVTGLALDAPTEPDLFSLCGGESLCRSVRGDIRSAETVEAVFRETEPELVFHLAAQPIVRVGYRRPLETYETNVMGTANVLEAARHSESVRSIVNVTTDKVYENRELGRGFREDGRLDGFDPYSNSKSCSELVTATYRRCFLAERGVAVSAARAGNVIGGGDFAPDRILPDAVRAAVRGEALRVRNPRSVRPFQHVLEPLFAYLRIAEAQYEHPELAGAYNVGPDEADCRETGELAELFCRCWGEGMRWECRAEENAPHEAGYLKLDCTAIRTALGWTPRWSIEEAVRETVAWTKVWRGGGDIPAEMEREIRLYIEN